MAEEVGPYLPAHLRERLRPWWQRTWLAARHTLRWTVRLLRECWRIAKPALRTGLQILLALLILLEEWGWRPLGELLGRLARWKPWANVEHAIARLPPYAALLVFALPSLILLPLKFLALFLIARGQVVLAALLFAAAKVFSTALIARLFVLTQPALMQIGWFAWCYDRFVPWKEALVTYVRGSLAWRVGRVWKERIKRAWVAQWRIWRPTVMQLRAGVRAAAGKAIGQVRRLVQELRAWRAARQR